MKVTPRDGAYWSTPFARWQGSFAHLHSLEFAAFTAKAELARRNIPSQAFDYAVLGTTIPQHGSFYGVPWMMGMVGNDRVGYTEELPDELPLNVSPASWWHLPWIAVTHPDPMYRLASWIAIIASALGLLALAISIIPLLN